MSDLASAGTARWQRITCPFRIDSFDDSIGFDNRRQFLDPPLNSGILQRGFERKNRSGSTKRGMLMTRTVGADG